MGAGSMPAATGLQNCAAGAPGKIALLREAGAGDVSPAGPSVGDGEGLEVVGSIPIKIQQVTFSGE